MSRKPQLIVIVGPTASGKSELAVKIAQKFNGEIISADSRQIYRGLNIGSAKVPGKWKVTLGSPTSIANYRSRTSRIFIYRGVPHHCIDFVSPKKIFTVAEFKKCAAGAIQNITNRGKIPIIVGGTGFWVDTLVYDLALPEVPPNQKLRRSLEKKSALELLIILKKLDPKRAQTIDQKNPRRLIRAIEIARALGEVPPVKKQSPYRTLWIGLLNPSYETWSHRIKKRVRKMVRHGLIAETKNLLIQKVPQFRIQEFGFEYQATLDYLDKKMTKQELYNRIVRDTLRYAQCQMRWFKRNRTIHWIDPEKATLLTTRFIQK